MKLNDFLRHPLQHSALENIQVAQHHLNPQNIEVSNTTQSIEPVPGGPGIWDISVPLDTNLLMFNFRSSLNIMQGGAQAGVTGIATRLSTEASTFSHSGTFAANSYNALYSKKAAAQNLSHKIFSSSGDNISLTEAHLVLINSTTRAFRTVWTNYGNDYYTLNVWGQVAIIG
jgi:hypothetical protein